MAYKKYIQRNGKLYGPYLYESKRVDGKVISEYRGGPSKKTFSSKKIKDFLFFFGLFVIIGMLFFFVFSNKGMTGKTVLSLDSSYEKGKPLEGTLQFTLKEGELIPADSEIIIENTGNSYQFPLNQIFQEDTSEGDYYVFGKTLNGSGQGYGLEGEVEVYPEVEFTLLIYNNIMEEENLTEQSAPITGQVSKKIGSLFKTSLVTLELKEEISGKVSKNSPFIYELTEGQTAELKPKSVRLDGEAAEDSLVSLKEENGKVTVTTDYSEIEKGFGENFIGENEKILSLDLSKLNLTLNEGELDVKLIYSDEELVSLTTSLKDGASGSEVIVEEPNISIKEPINETPVNETIQVPEVIVLSSELTSEEINILNEKFGNISLITTNSERFNGRIILGYSFADKYTVEFSYDSDLSESVLQTQMENDRIKFLKDIANSVSANSAVSAPFVNSNSSYNY